MSDLELRRHKVEEMRGKRERRVFDAGMQLREDRDSGQVRLIGWACRTNVEYEIGVPSRGGFVEVVRPGSFRRSLGNSPDVVLVVQHGAALSGLPIARTRSGTLMLSEDDRGLKVDADLDPEDDDVRALRGKYARGDLDGQMSFAFYVPEGGDQWTEDYKRRTITQAEINQGDVSVVTYGASPSTSSQLVSRSASATAFAALPDYTTPAKERLALARARAAGQPPVRSVSLIPDPDSLRLARLKIARMRRSR